MDAEKLKQLEAKLREMLVEEDLPIMETERVEAQPSQRVVIRRRKGQADKRISLS